MVEVEGELCSEPLISLITGNLQGKSPKSGALGGFLRKKTTYSQRLTHEFPSRRNREENPGCREFDLQNRERP